MLPLNYLGKLFKLKFSNKKPALWHLHLKGEDSGSSGGIIAINYQKVNLLLKSTSANDQKP
jgi:hypothetical protein